MGSRLRNIVLLAGSPLVGCLAPSADTRDDDRVTVTADVTGSGQAAVTACVPRGDAVYVDDCGALGNSTADDATAIEMAIGVAATQGKGLVFSAGKTYLTSRSLRVMSSESSVPAFIEGNNSTLRAHSAYPSSAPPDLMVLENPHGNGRWNFELRNLVVDGNNKANQVLRVWGGQHFSLRGLKLTKGRGAGLVLRSSSGHGIYYATIENVLARENAGDGFKAENTDSPKQNRTANVSFIACRAQFNIGHGYNIDFASLTMTGTSAEKNDGYGYYLRDVQSVDIFGGYAEHNHGSYAANIANTEYAGDGTPDVAINVSSLAARVTAIGGRFIGEISADRTKHFIP